MSIRYEYNDDFSTTNVELMYGDNWAAQTFTPTDSHDITKVRLYLEKALSPGDLTVGIRATSSGHPTGSNLTSGTLVEADIPASRAWVYITLDSSYSLSASTKYAIVVSIPDGDVSNYVNWYKKTTSVYSGGNTERSDDAGVSWTAKTYDQAFEEWGDASPPADKTYSKILVAVGSKGLYYESTPGTMTELTAAQDNIDTSKPLICCEAFQKLFIANQTNLEVVDFINTKLTTATAPANNPNPGTILTGDTSSASMIVDYVAPDAKTIYGKRTTTATFQAEKISGTDDDGNDIDFDTSIVETDPPHWYDWTVFGNVADADKYGTMPVSAYLVCRYRGRIVLSGNPNYPHQWYMSKIGFPFNFLYGTNDPMTAVAGTNADAGELGDIVKALIPFGDDYLIFGCANSIHLLDGDPVAGGSIDELDNKTGIFGPFAWCIDGVGDLWFYGTGGLYKMTGGRSKPVNVSQSHLPQLVDTWAAVPGTHRVVLTYDPFRNGIIISRTVLDGGTNLNYWYDLKTEGFYPETYPTACGIFSSCYYDSDAAATKGLILGCNDGYIRNFYDADKDDDVGATNTAISSYVTWPIQHLTEDNDTEGKLTSLTIELAGGGADGDFGDSDGVSYELHVGNDAETCLEKIKDGDTAFTSGSFLTVDGVKPTGRQNRIRVRVRGAYLGLKFLNSTDSETWSINRVFGDVKEAGRIK